MAEKNKTPLQEVKEQIADITKKKASELAKIEANLQESQNKVEEAAAAMQTATEKMDVNSYEKAKDQKRKAQIACEMYQNRKAQLEAPECFISETDSDRAIDSLLEYEKQLAEDFRGDFAEALQKLEQILANYDKTIQEVENTLAIWVENIHANYRDETKMWIDKETGQYTNRSNSPVPIRRLPFKGCDEANRLREFIRDAKKVCNKGA